MKNYTHLPVGAFVKLKTDLSPLKDQIFKAYPEKAEDLDQYKVNLYTLDNSQYGYETIDNIVPIEATEETLVKFGFKSTSWKNDLELDFPNNNAYIESVFYLDAVNLEIVIEGSAVLAQHGVKYIHQIQSALNAVSEDLQLTYKENH